VLTLRMNGKVIRDGAVSILLLSPMSIVRGMGIMICKLESFFLLI
jgi:hypothetical protein